MKRVRTRAGLISTYIFIMGGNYSAMDPMEVPVPDLAKLLERDGYLKPYEREIRRR